MANRVKKEEYEKKHLVIIETMPGETVLIASGNGTVKTGQVLAQKTADGTWHKFNKAGTDGTEIPRRVYKGEDDLDTTSAEAVAVCVRAGILDKDLVVGINANDYKGIAELERNGIYLEEVKNNAN
jgi:hypothetical protein|nr:MAG TPA: head decoration protein D [Bacteriophage sp.]